MNYYGQGFSQERAVTAKAGAPSLAAAMKVYPHTADLVLQRKLTLSRAKNYIMASLHN